MLIDHLYYFLPQFFALWFRYFGRLSAPIFFFIAVQGFLHTSNRKKYLIRLYLAALIMDLGSWFLNCFLENYLGIPEIPPILSNIFLTMALGITLLSVYEWTIKQKSLPKVLLGLIGFAFIIPMFSGVEYGLISLILLP